MRLAAQDLKLKLVYLMLIVLVVSIFSGATPITQAKNLHKYSGEEIFAGIVFGQGEISKKFPEIWNTNDYNVRNSDKSKELTQLLISEMKKIDPQYFNDLKKSVYEKDLKLIDEEFSKGGDLLKEAAEKVNMGSSEHADLVSGKCVETLGAAIFVLVLAAGGAVDYLYVYNATKFWGITSNDKESKLATEMFVKDVADKLN
ncbi:sporulation delaying protein family toxin [Bacillus subtilis]|nr:MULTISPECIES: sporulation delaying protein family toxin [Bacillus]ADV94850.1 hypothetical protein BSn5_11170 [Bacillus subtilis BSn5]AMK74546.1 hypothetical protein AWV81_21600 [Bacillus subtilis subsp. natto]ASB63105.1 hypothetical protein CDO84_19840 [Bacillus sp. MD-5]KAA0932817.1 sporulation delaying protein family toxin [Bacillus sp. ANT_WA51]KIH40689.1 hypothetical protein SC22_01370 [Bacillus sp. A053]KKB91080.1 hypothetical protein WB24_19830 [Bacillus sp. CMAA 1185]MCH4864033.1 s